MDKSTRDRARVKPEPGARSHGNGNGEPEEPIFGPQQKHALAIVRLILGRKVSEKTRRLLPPEWSDLAGFVETSKGLGHDALYGRVQRQYVANLKARHPDTAKLLRDSMTMAWERAKEEDPGDEEAEAEAGDGTERRSFLDGILGATEFNRTEFKLQWLIRRILVADLPTVVGAPKKTMKTSTMVDLAVSLASGTPFLGTFDIPEPVPVLLLSGESGGFTLQETVRRVCRAKGIDVESLESRLFVGSELPQLGNNQDLDDLALYIRSAGIRVVIIDPLYLCLLQGIPGRRMDPSNLFDVGPLLMAISRTCLNAGAAPVLVHHFKKNGADPHELPELEELAYAGIQEFARQWILLKRRKRFEPGSGVHQLWLTVGCSAGHSGEWAVDIDEGVMGDDFHGRQWNVTIKTAAEARSEETEGKQAGKAEKAAEKTRESDEVKAKRVRDDAVTALIRLEELIPKLDPPRPLSKTEWRDALHGWNSDRFGPAFSFLFEHKMIVMEKFTKLTAQGRNQPYEGWRPAPKNESRTEPD